jgi:hypothetical protein
MKDKYMFGLLYTQQRTHFIGGKGNGEAIHYRPGRAQRAGFFKGLGASSLKGPEPTYRPGQAHRVPGG